MVISIDIAFKAYLAWANTKCYFFKGKRKIHNNIIQKLGLTLENIGRKIFSKNCLKYIKFWTTKTLLLYIAMPLQSLKTQQKLSRNDRPCIKTKQKVNSIVVATVFNGIKVTHRMSILKKQLPNDYTNKRTSNK